MPVDASLTADQVRATDEAIEAMIRGYTRNAGVWDLADALATVCAKVVRRRAEGDEAPVEVTSELFAGMLGPPSHRKAEVAARTGRTGVVLGLSLGTMAGGDILFVEVSRMPGIGALTLTGGLGEVTQESARVGAVVGAEPTSMCTCSRVRCARTGPRPASRWWPRWCPR